MAQTTLTKYTFDNTIGDVLPTMTPDTVEITYTDTVNGSVTTREVFIDDSNSITQIKFDINPDALLTCNYLRINNEVTNLSSLFYECHNLTFVDTSNWNTKNVVDMHDMFNGCSSLVELDLSSFDSNSVTNFSAIFQNCTNLVTLDISNFHFGGVKQNVPNDFFSNCNKLKNIGMIYCRASSFNSLQNAAFNNLKATPVNVYYHDANLSDLTPHANVTYVYYDKSTVTLPYELNKLPNGVADYIDVVNGVYVQRVGKRVFNGGTDESWHIGKYDNFEANNECTIFSTSIKDKKDNYCETKMCDKWAVLNKEVISVVNVVGICTGGNSDSFFVNVRNSTATTVEQWKTYLQSNPFTYMYELATPIYTPLTDEEKASLPLSAYSNGYIQLSSDELRPSKFEFRAKSSNRMQLDMLETGHYYLNAPTGNVKLGNVDINVTEMPCIINVSDASNKRLICEATEEKQVPIAYGAWVDELTGQLSGINMSQAERDAYSEYMPVTSGGSVTISHYSSRVSGGAGIVIAQFNINKQLVKVEKINHIPNTTYEIKSVIENDTHYIRFSVPMLKSEYDAGYKTVSVTFGGKITLSKLPSHRIPTTFTQGMKSSVNFGYWQGIENAKPSYIYTTDMVEWKVIDGVLRLNGDNGIELHSITGKYGTTVTVEDEIDISTGKYTKRVGKYVIDGSVDPHLNNIINFETNIIRVTFLGSKTGIKPKNQWGSYGLGVTETLLSAVNFNTKADPHVFVGSTDIYLFMRLDSFQGLDHESVKDYFRKNPMTVYYELETPEITYLDLERNEFRTASNKTNLQAQSFTLLKPQVKLAPLSYPTTLSPNTQYTVFHNRKNYNGSVKTPMINLGGTEAVATGSRTVVTTPSTLAHNELQFIGGENTVEKVMVVHGDWTKEGKTVDYFEGLQSSIIGDKTLENLVDEPTEIWSNKVTDSSNGGALDYVSMDDIIAVGYGSRAKLPEVQVDTNVRTYGMTLQNLSSIKQFSINGADHLKSTPNSGMFKANTIYTRFVTITKNTLEGTNENGQVAQLKYSVDGYTFFNDYQLKEGEIGTFKFVQTTPQNISTYALFSAIRIFTTNTGGVLEGYEIILEGDYTNMDIPYFEGMKSVENPVYHSVGKNLSPINTFTDTFISGSTRPQINKVIARNIEIAKDKSYIVSCDTSYGTSFLGKVLLSDVPLADDIIEHNDAYVQVVNVGGKEVNWNKSFSGYKYVHITTGGEQRDLTLDEVGKTITITNIQLEQGTQPTEYEPYKENILSTPQGTVLRGVGSYKDVIGWNDGIIRRNCVEFTITGEEGYSITSITENTNTIMCTISWKKLGLENKILANDNVNMVICDKLPSIGGNADTPHIRQDSGDTYSVGVWFWFDKTKFSTYTSQGINDYIKSIGGLTIIAPLANTEYEDVEITGGGNWNKIVLDGSENWIFDNSVLDIISNTDRYYLVNGCPNAISSPCYTYNNVGLINLPMGTSKNDTEHICIVSNNLYIRRYKDEIHSLEEFKQWLSENPLTLWYLLDSETVSNTNPLIFNHGTLYTTTDTHPSTFLDFSLKTTNRYTVKDFDKLKYTVLTEQPFCLNGVDYPASPTGMTIIDITGIADSSIYSDDTMITVVQDDGSYYADGVLTQFKGTKTFTKEFIRTSNGTYDTGMTLLEPMELCGVGNVADTYSPTKGIIYKNIVKLNINDYGRLVYVLNDLPNKTALVIVKPNNTAIQSTQGSYNSLLLPRTSQYQNQNMGYYENPSNFIVYCNSTDMSYEELLQYLKDNDFTIYYDCEGYETIQATPISTYISTRPENGNIIAQDIQIQAEYLNYDNEQSIISPRMLGDGDEIRWEQGSQCYVYENDNEYIPLTEYNELFGANLQAQEYTQYAESVDGADIEVGVALKEKAVYEQTYVKYEDNIVYPETMENIDETNGVEVDYICGATWQNPNDLSDIRHLGELREDGQYDVTIRRSGDDEIRLLEGTTHIGLDYDELPPSEFELTFFNNGGVEVGKYGDTNHTLEDCVENSKLASGTVYGQTLVNLASHCELNLLSASKIETGFKLNAMAEDFDHSIGFLNIVKPDTYYTYIFTSDTAFEYQTGWDATNSGTWNQPTHQAVVGLNVLRVKTEANTTKTSLLFRTTGNRVGNKDVYLTNFMILEGDYTNLDIPYFEGIGSTVVNGFSSCGKNLFDPNKFKVQGTYNGDFEYSNNKLILYGYVGYYLDYVLKEGETYTFSWSEAKNCSNIRLYDLNGWSGENIVNDLFISPTTLTMKKDCRFRIWGVQDGVTVITNLQIERSSVHTAFEEPKTINYTLPTPITLCKVGDVYDTFDVVSGIQTCNTKKVMASSLTWEDSFFSDPTCTCYRYRAEANNVKSNSPILTLQYNHYGDDMNTEGIREIVNSIYFQISKDKITTNLKDWLKDNDFEITYQLKTPQTIQHTLIPSTTQTTQEPTFILPQPLRSVPNGICDRLYWDENKGHYCIEKRIGKLVLDNTISNINHGGYSNTDYVEIYMHFTTGALIENIGYCEDSSFTMNPYIGVNYTNSVNYKAFAISTSKVSLIVPRNEISEVIGETYTNNSNQLRTYLSLKPVTLLIPLTTPEIIDLPYLDEKVELPTQPNIYPIGYRAIHEKANPEIGLTIPYKVLNMPTQPVNLNFVMDIADYVLTWDDVKEARQYNIILNDEVIATVKEPQYNTGEEMYGYILVEANNEIGDSVSKELYIKTVPNAPAQLTVAHNPSTDYYDFEISFIDKSAIADYYTVQYRVDGGEWIINNIENDKLAIGDKKLWSFSVYEIKESIEVWATATNDVGTNDILPSAIYYMSPTPQWTYRMNSKEVFLRWMDNSPYDVKYKLRYSYLSNGQYQYAYFEGDKEEIGKLYEAVVPLAENDEVAIALCIVSERENLYCKPVKASKELDPNIVPPLNFNYRWLARGLIEFYWQDQYDVDVEYEYILETMKGSESVWTQVNETITSTDVEGTGTVYRVEYQLEDLEQIRMKVRMKWAMNETQWTETLTTVFIPVEGNPPTYIRRTQTAEGLLVEWEAQAYIDSYHIYVIDNTTKEVLQHLETQDNNIIVDLDYSNSIELAIYEISRFSGGIESDPTDSMVFTPTMSEITMLQNIYQPCVEEHSIEVSTVQKGSKQPYVIHDVSYTPNVESESDLQVNVSTPFIISYHPTEIDVHQVGSKAIADMDLKIKTLDTRTEETVEVMTFERITDTYDMNFQVYTPSVMSYPITLEVSKVRIVCLGDSLTSGHPFYWAETGTGMVEASYPYQLSRRLKNQYEVINSGYGSDTTDRCLARFDRDVLRYFPQYCIFQCGTNDLYWAMAESLNNQEALDMKMKVVRENTMEVVKRCWDNGIIPIIGTLIPRTGATGIYKTALYEHNEWIISWCNEQSASGRDIFYVDFFNAGKDVVPPTPLEDPNNPGAMNPIYDGDRVYDEFGNLEKEGRGIHLNPEGYKIMASAVPLSIFQTYDTGLKMYRDAQCTFEDNYDDSDKLNSFYTIEVDNVRRSKTKTIIRYVKNIGRTQVLFAMYGTDMYNMTMEFIGTDGSRGQFANGLLAPDMVAKVTIEINLGDEDFKASFNMHLASREYSQS